MSLKLIPLVIALVIGILIGQLVQAKFLTRPCPTVKEAKCPDCKCPEVKPCPPQYDFSKLNLKKGKNSPVHIHIYSNHIDTLRLRR